MATSVVDASNSSSGAEPKALSKAESIKLIGGLVAVGIGTLVVGAIAVIALLKGGDTAATVSSAAGGVIATMVGAYFGVKVGSDQTKAALDGQKAEAAKAQTFAAHLPSEKADDVIKQAEEAATKALQP
ncbi:MAG TPA: hypothetical protein VHZ54_05605 [Solirubrobacterales bacterium]|jgi:hypothetical protein|nr:hypothetical protein [Solirubrobacterales bacterium]